MANLFIHQIYYNEETRFGLDAGFIPLDNMSNARPDWYEFWPIRQYLHAHLEQMNEDDLYGFFSPKFGRKLGLTSSDVIGFVQQKFRADVDAFIFSPCWDQAAFFRNVFEQGNYWHAGLLDMSTEFFKRIGQPVDLHQLITHSQNTAFCNYTIAKPKFWREWLALGEQFFQMVEAGEDDFARSFSDNTYYIGGYKYPMKTFVQERLATYILATGGYAIEAFDTFSLPASMPMADNEYCLNLLACDAYKQVYVQTGQPTFAGAYQCLRNRITAEFVQRVL